MVFEVAFAVVVFVVLFVAEVVFAVVLTVVARLVSLFVAVVTAGFLVVVVETGAFVTSPVGVVFISKVPPAPSAKYSYTGVVERVSISSEYILS